MADEETDFFEGTGGPKECAKFLRSVRAHAFSEGKARDDDWIADYAATRMTDSAVLWFESLEEETQSSWKLLRRALLDQYAAPPTSSRSTSPMFSASAPVPSSVSSQSFGDSSSIAAAAASRRNRIPEHSRGLHNLDETMSAGTDSPQRAPTPSLSPPASPSRTRRGTRGTRGTKTPSGLLRVLGINNQTDVYISSQVGMDPSKPSLLQTTTSRKNALQVTCVPLPPAQSKDKKYINVKGGNFRLGMIFDKMDVDLRIGSASHAAFIAVKSGIRDPRKEKDMVHPHTQWTGKLQTSLWRVASDGEVTAELHDPDGTAWVLDILCLPISTGSSDYEVHFYVDPQCRRPNGPRGRLIFESI